MFAASLHKHTVLFVQTIDTAFAPCCLDHAESIGSQRAARAAAGAPMQMRPSPHAFSLILLGCAPLQRALGRRAREQATAPPAPYNSEPQNRRCNAPHAACGWRPARGWQSATKAALQAAQWQLKLSKTTSEDMGTNNDSTKASVGRRKTEMAGGERGGRKRGEKERGDGGSGGAQGDSGGAAPPSQQPNRGSRLPCGLPSAPKRRSSEPHTHARRRSLRGACDAAVHSAPSVLGSPDLVGVSPTSSMSSQVHGAPAPACCS